MNYIQALQKQRNKIGNKLFPLQQNVGICPRKNEKWARKNWETAPNRARLCNSSSVKLNVDGGDNERGRSSTMSSGEATEVSSKAEKERLKRGA
jgi:hypothetical protein